jgi:hypothetical protein
MQGNRAKVRQRTLVWLCPVQKSAETSHAVKDTTLRNQQVRSDRNTPNNKPHIIIHDNKKGTSMLTSLRQPVTVRITRFNIQKFYMVLTLRLCCVQTSEQTQTFSLYILNWWIFCNRGRVFTARYELSPYIEQTTLRSFKT